MQKIKVLTQKMKKFSVFSALFRDETDRQTSWLIEIMYQKGSPRVHSTCLQKKLNAKTQGPNSIDRKVKRGGDKDKDKEMFGEWRLESC